MKKTHAKRIPAILLTVVLLFTTVFSTTVLVSAASFTPRYSAPSYDNPYYYSSKNIFYSAGYGMPNCTAYAFGRAYEILGYEPSLSHGNAQDWYGYNLNGGYYSYGSTPKVGAIACWSHDSSGHVAVVESIDGDTVTYSNSAWSGTNFYLTYGSVSNPGSGGNSWWNFQGYIYILDSDSDSSNVGQTPAEPLPTDDYLLGTYKVNVSSTLNMRSGVGTGYSTVASVPNGTELVVTDIDSDSSYVWGYTNYNGINGWVALSYCDYISSSSEEETQATDSEETVSETEPVEEIPDNNTEESTDDADATEAEEATEAAEATEATEATEETTEPTEVHDYVLYIANENSEETVAYPLSDLYQTAVVTLDAGNYLISMSEDGNKISGTYELVLTAKNEVSVTYENQDYFLIVCNEIEVSEPDSDDKTSTSDEAQDAAQETTTVTVVKDTKQSVSKSSTSDTPTQSAAAAESTNGAIQTGQDVKVEAAMILAFSLATLALLWFRRKMFM